MKLLILDGNSIINRAYYGIRAFATRDGQPTNGIYGFLNILHKLQSAENPNAICVAFDRKAPTFRHLQYDLYKANRHGMPEELASQMPLMKQVLEAMRIPIYECDGWEADDIIGTVGRICREKEWQCVIATGDRDSLQLIDGSVTVRLANIRGGQTDWTAYTEEVFQSEYGFAPIRLIDMKALMGDHSDNIPGVPGIGEKTAKELLLQFGSLEGVYGHLEDGGLRPAVLKKLTEGADSAKLSYALATIRTDAPIDFSPEMNMVQLPDKAALYELFCRLEFVKFIDRYHLRDGASMDPVTLEAAVATKAELHDPAEALGQLQGAKTLSLFPLDGLRRIAVFNGNCTFLFSESTMQGDYHAFLRELLSLPVCFVLHDSKSLFRLLLREGLPITEHFFDTAVAAYVLDSNQGKYEPERLSVRYLSRDCGEDPAGIANVLFALQPVLLEELRKENLEKLYYEIELPLCPVLAEMEQTGILVDRLALLSFGNLLTRRINDKENEIYEYAGHKFNILSTKQLGEVLFERLHLPALKKTKTGYSTNAEVLEKLKGEHPIIPAILEYRMLTKLQSTYAEGLLKCIEEDGRIRTTFQNTVTATGRLSSTDPNLQNIPVRTELGSEIRKMFVPQDGWMFVDADYSQIELRVLAHIANDPGMQEAFRSGEDFHTLTAAKVFGVAPDEVSPELRRRAKAVNFGVVYGISEFSLAEDLGVSRVEAKAFIDAYLERFAGVADYQSSIVKSAYDTGFVSTVFGRKREIPELKDSKYPVRMAGERIALNSPIQGTAADIMKIATVRVRDAFRKAKLKARLVLQIHDELIVECPPEEVAAVQKLLIREMEGAAELAVPLLVEAKTGESWYAAK